MKNFLVVSLLSTLLLAAGDCTPGKKESRLRGRLEVAGICMNYTIAVLDGDPGKDAVEETWTDETTGKSYHKVFKLGNPCDFPATIKQGDEFYFTPDTSAGKTCAVCMAYYPTPAKSLNIKVVP